MSDGLTNMQVLPVANLGYLCLSLRWAEYELQRRKKGERDRGGVRCGRPFDFVVALAGVPDPPGYCYSTYDWLQKNLHDLSIINLLVSMTVKASSVMSGPEPLIVFALR